QRHPLAAILTRGLAVSGLENEGRPAKAPGTSLAARRVQAALGSSWVLGEPLECHFYGFLKASFLLPRSPARSGQPRQGWQGDRGLVQLFFLFLLPPLFFVLFFF